MMKQSGMLRINKFTLSIYLIMTIFGCKSSPTGPMVTQNVQLTLDYVTCTEVWLRLGFTNSPGGGHYRIARDGETILAGTFSGANTIVMDTTVQVKMNYTYTAYKMINAQASEVSYPLTVTTLDSTSNNFSWQTFNIGGDAGSCLLRDVAIINDTLAYAVGEVYMKDSTGQNDPIPYNILRWDGVNWNLGRINFYTFCGQSHMSPYPTDGIIALNPADVWIAATGEVTRWNGNSQSDPRCVESPNSFGIKRMWGTDSTLVYAVGVGGNIARYDGNTWDSLATGTTFDIQDVWGTVNAPTGHSQVLAIACNRFTTDGTSALQLSGNTVTGVQTAGLPLNLSSIWSPSGKEWYVCGDALYKAKSLTSPWQKIPELPAIYQECVRGNGPNDILVVGDIGLVSHFNGATWHTFPSQPGNYVGLAVKGNLFVAVGYLSSGVVAGAATVLMGRRN